MPDADIRFEVPSPSPGPTFIAVSDSNPLPVRASQAMISRNLSGKIEYDNEFQVIQAANLNRRGGRIHNSKFNSNPMWVFVGDDEPSKSASFYMQPGDPPFDLQIGAAGVMADRISITGTAGEAFFAVFQGGEPG